MDCGDLGYANKLAKVCNGVQKQDQSAQPYKVGFAAKSGHQARIFARDDLTILRCLSA